MQKVIEAGFKSLNSMLSPAMLGIFIKSLLITLLALGCFIGVAITGMHFALESFSLVGRYAWMAFGVSGIIVSLIAWFLFPTILPLIISFFDDSIVKVIENENYPPAQRGTNWPFMQELRHDVGFAIKAILLNILILPLYLIVPINFFIFYILNGYLIGNEFYMTVARRNYDYKTAKANRKRNAGTVFAAGVLITLLATIPIINLIAPFWGVALMTHLFHSQKDKPLIIN